MGLFDFDIHDATPEKKKLYEVSEDKGQTWEKRMRSYYSERSILYYPGESPVPIKMTIPVPANIDAEEYIDELLDGMLNDFLRYNSDWEFE